MDTLETRISEQLEKTNATPLSVSKEDALTMLSLIADERGHIRNEAAAAMRTLRKQFPLAMYEQAVKFASNGEFRIDGEIGDDEIRGLALIAGIEYPAESVMETPPSSTAGDSAAPLPGRKPKVVPPKPRIRNTEKQRGGPNQNEADYAAVRDVFLNSIELVPNHSDASETYDRIMFAVD
ncbi:MAG TPA: hypothetical protein PK765_00850 [bacterium]|nr:hypothetical protein [bacterium]